MNVKSCRPTTEHIHERRQTDAGVFIIHFAKYGTLLPNLNNNGGDWLISSCDRQIHFVIRRGYTTPL